MKNLSYFILAFAMLCLSAEVYSQTYLQEVNGRPIRANTNTEVSGDPYLFPEWKEAVVELADGRSFKNIPVKLDILNQQLLFAGSNNEELEFIDKVKAFIIKDENRHHIFKNGYPSTKSTTSDAFFEVLSEGKITLLKRQWKVIWEEKTYNSATKTQNILDNTAYYVIQPGDNSLDQIKLQKKAIMNMIKDKEPKVSEFIKKESIDFDEEGTAKIITFYNSL